MGDMPPRLVLIENDDKGGVRSRPETVDAIAAVLLTWRGMGRARRSLVGEADPTLYYKLHRLDEQWPGETGADRAARPRRSAPEDALSVAERLGAAEAPDGPQ